MMMPMFENMMRVIGLLKTFQTVIIIIISMVHEDDIMWTITDGFSEG